MFKTTSAVLLGLAGTASAFWRMECPGRLGVARIDPIVNSGEVSAHAHSLHGSSGTLQFRPYLAHGPCFFCIYDSGVDIMNSSNMT